MTHDSIQSLILSTSADPFRRFRWATCQLDILEKCPNLRKLRESLRSLPKTLEETYGRILANIDEIYRDYAIRILQFLTYSERPLTVEEVIDALVVDPDENVPFDPEDRMPDPRDIMRICPSLITVVRTVDYCRWHDHPKKVMELRLAHFSVRQYLVSTKIAATFPGSMTRIGTLFQDAINELNAKGTITRICLSYLSYLSHLKEERSIREPTVSFSLAKYVARSWTVSAKVRKLTVRFPLAKYSAQYWIDHAKSAETEEKVQDSVLNFLGKREAYAVWGRLFDPERPEGEEPGPNRMTASPLYYISLSGLRRVAEMLLERKVDVNAQGGVYGTALQAASAKGHKAIVQMLLNKGADVNINIQGKSYGTALMAASAEGYRDIVLMLLDKGADVHAQGGRRGTALQAACIEGHRDIVLILLDKGADVHAQGGMHGTALQAACIEGHRDIVQILLNKGAKVNAQREVYGTALQGASMKNHKDIVQMLLDEGAGVNTQGGKYNTALQAACIEGHRDIVQILLNKGANVNAQGGIYGTALQAASTEGHREIIQMLLGKGADVNTQGGRYNTALQAASVTGHRDIMQMLLDKGADINAQGGIYDMVNQHLGMGNNGWSGSMMRGG